ncbi:hypothetical protein B0H17DRAFT_1026844, partial [Mycena rosella]
IGATLSSRQSFSVFAPDIYSVFAPELMITESSMPPPPESGIHCIDIWHVAGVPARSSGIPPMRQCSARC